jgi:hypothetical protein
MPRLKETPERCGISQCQKFPLCCRKGYDVPGIDESHKKDTRAKNKLSNTRQMASRSSIEATQDQ